MILAIFTTMLLVFVAGCSGGDSEGTGGEKPFTVQASTTITAGKLPRPQFVDRVNKFCRKAWLIILDNFAQYYRWQTKKLSESKRFSMTARLTLMAGIDFYIFDKIYELGAPGEDRLEIEEMIGAMQEAVERGQRLGPLHSVAEITALFADFNRRAGQYGLSDCLVDETHIAEIEKA
jgi:hypothetical protein